MRDFVAESEAKVENEAIIGALGGVIGSIVVIWAWITSAFGSNRYVGALHLIATPFAISVAYCSIRNLVRPPVRNRIERHGPFAVAEVNSMLSGEIPSALVAGARFTQNFLVFNFGVRLIALRPSEIVLLSVSDRSMSHGIDDKPWKVLLHTQKETFQTNLSKADGVWFVNAVMPLCPNAKYGVDTELDGKFTYFRWQALRTLKKKDFPTVEQVLANQGVSPTAPVSASLGSSPSLGTRQSVGQQPSAQNGFAPHPSVVGNRVTVDGNTEFPKVCPCCGKTGTSQHKILVKYKTPLERAIDIVGLAALLGGGIVRGGHKQAYLRPWMCESCPSRVRFAAVARIGALITGFGAAWSVLMASFDGDRSLLSLALSPKPLICAGLCTSLAYAQARLQLLRAGKMDATCITLIQTHPNFRAAISGYVV
jgi:hypothetical protein